MLCRNQVVAAGPCLVLSASTCVLVSSPGLRPPRVCQNFQTGRPLRLEGGPSPCAVSSAAAPAWATVSAGPEGTEAGPGLGEKIGLCRAHQLHPDQGQGLPTDATWCLLTLGPLWPELPLPPPWDLWPGHLPCSLGWASAHSLGDAQASCFSGGELEVGLATPCEQERGSRQKGQACSTDHQGAALRVTSQPTHMHGPPTLACSPWQGPRVVLCSPSPALLPRPLGRPTQADQPQPWPSLACSSPQHSAGQLDGDPTGTPAPGKAGFTLMLEKELCSQTQSQVNARAGGSWPGRVPAACSLLWERKWPLSHPQPPAPPGCLGRARPTPVGTCPVVSGQGHHSGFTTASGLQKSLFAGRILK